MEIFPGSSSSLSPDITSLPQCMSYTIAYYLHDAFCFYSMVSYHHYYLCWSNLVSSTAAIIAVYNTVWLQKDTSNRFAIKIPFHTAGDCPSHAHSMHQRGGCSEREFEPVLWSSCTAPSSYFHSDCVRV